MCGGGRKSKPQNVPEPGWGGGCGEGEPRVPQTFPRGEAWPWTRPLALRSRGVGTRARPRAHGPHRTAPQRTRTRGGRIARRPGRDGRPGKFQLVREAYVASAGSEGGYRWLPAAACGFRPERPAARLRSVAPARLGCWGLGRGGERAPVGPARRREPGFSMGARRGRLKEGAWLAPVWGVWPAEGAWQLRLRSCQRL